MCDKDINALQDYLKGAKEEGYILEYTELPDRLKVSFNYKCTKSDGDYYKEYIEYLDNRVICYGEFGTFTFRLYDINKQPDNFYLYSEKFGVRSQLGMLDKLTGDIITKQYDCELAHEDFKNFLEEYDLLDSYNELDDFAKDSFEAAIYSDDVYPEKSIDICRQLIDLFTEYNIGIDLDDYDLWCALTNIGLHYTARALIIVMIITLVGYDYHTKHNNDVLEK